MKPEHLMKRTWKHKYIERNADIQLYGVSYLSSPNDFAMHLIYLLISCNSNQGRFKNSSWKCKQRRSFFNPVKRSLEKL